ncbi:hypothetical protein [Asanoa ishikariensis]|nr:hypothetical protein [Asanoa ishikariensis]
MSAEPSGPAVVAFGAGEAVPDRSWPFVDRLRRGIVDPRRLILAGTMLAAAVAGFVALIAPWFSAMLALGEPDPNTGVQSDRPTEFHLDDLGTLATVYLVCLLVVAVACVLALAGPPAARSVARLTGLTLAGASLAVLVSLMANIQNSIMRSFFFLFQEDIEIERRGGLTAAFVAVLLAAVALFLSGRGSAAQATGGPALGWQPPRPVRDETATALAAAAPLDLTVQPARPFALPDSDDDRDR